MTTEPTPGPVSVPVGDGDQRAQGITPGIDSVEIELRDWATPGWHILDDPKEYGDDVFVAMGSLPEIIRTWFAAVVEAGLVRVVEPVGDGDLREQRVEQIGQIMADHHNSSDSGSDHLVGALEYDGEAREIYDEVVSPLLAERDTEIARLREELKLALAEQGEALYALDRWKSGMRRKTWPALPTAPDGLSYAAKLRDIAYVVDEQHEDTLTRAAVQMAALHDAVGPLLARVDALSTLLRGMARRVGEYRQAATAEADLLDATHGGMLRGTIARLTRERDAALSTLAATPPPRAPLHPDERAKLGWSESDEQARTAVLRAYNTWVAEHPGDRCHPMAPNYDLINVVTRAALDARDTTPSQDGRLAALVADLRRVHYDEDGDCPGCGLDEDEAPYAVAECDVLAAIAKHAPGVSGAPAATTPSDDEPPEGTTVEYGDGQRSTRYGLGWYPGPFNWAGLRDQGARIVSTPDAPGAPAATPPQDPRALLLAYVTATRPDASAAHLTAMVDRIERSTQGYILAAPGHQYRNGHNKCECGAPGVSVQDTAPTPVSYDEHERQMLEVIRQRDEYHEWADRLAAALAPVDVVGEHSSGHCPWRAALEWAEGRALDGIERQAYDLAVVERDRAWREIERLRALLDARPAGVSAEDTTPASPNLRQVAPNLGASPEDTTPEPEPTEGEKAAMVEQVTQSHGRLAGALAAEVLDYPEPWPAPVSPQDTTPTPGKQNCPLGRCDHVGYMHDVDDAEGTRPMCCVEGCDCGKPAPGVSVEDTPGPRVWTAGDPEPDPRPHLVRDRGSNHWYWNSAWNGWIARDTTSYPNDWGILLSSSGPLTEVPVSPPEDTTPAPPSDLPGAPQSGAPDTTGEVHGG